MGCSSPEEVLSTPLAQLLDAFVILDEDGRPFDLRELPGRHALAGEESRPTLTQSVFKATGEVRWSVTKATPVRDEHGAVVLAVNIIEDVTDARLAERQQRFLSAASMLVSSSLDIDVTLDKVAGAAVPELADWCCVDVPDERGVVRRAALAAGDADRDALERMRDALSMDADDPGSPAHVLRTGRGVARRRVRRRRRAGLGRRRRGAGRRAARQRHALGDGRPDDGRRPRHRRRHPRDLAQRAAAGRGRARAGRRARAPRRHRGGERAPARRALAHRHHAAAQPAAAAAADRAGRDDRRALSRRRGDERRRRRLLRRLRRRRRVDGRGRRRHRQGARRRHHHLAGALHDAHGGDVRALAERRAGAPQRRAGRRPRPPPDLHRGVRAHRAGRRTGRCGSSSRAAAIPRPSWSRPPAAPRRSARPGRCWAPSTAGTGRRATSPSASATPWSSTPTA